MIAFLESCDKNRLKPGDRVEGKFGPLVPNPKAEPGKKTRRIRSNATGTVVKAANAKLWKVKVDQTGEFINVRSCAMKVIDNAVGLPVDEVVKKVNNVYAKLHYFIKYLVLICYDLTNDNYVLQNDIFMQELPERLLKNPSIVVTDKSSEAQMDPKQTNYASSPSVLDHLLVEEDVSPDNEELFAPDPETVPYLTAALLAEEKANDHFCKATEEKETTEDEGVENKHQERYRLAWKKIKQLTGTEIKVGKSNDEISWKVVVSCELDKIGHERTKRADLKNHFRIMGDLGEAMENFWSGDMWAKLENMNNAIEKQINKPRRVLCQRTIKLLSKSDLLTFIALIIGAANQSANGRNLWGKDINQTLSSSTDYSEYMNRTRFFEIKSVIHFMMEDESVKHVDDWWKVRNFVDGFNKRRVDELYTGIVMVLDESMSAMVPRYVPN